MGLVFKICLYNVLIVLLLAVLATNAADSGYRDFLFFLGLSGMLGVIVDVLASLFLFLLKRKEWAKGFIISAGVLALLSGVSCSVYFPRM